MKWFKYTVLSILLAFVLDMFLSGLVVYPALAIYLGKTCLPTSALPLWADLLVAAVSLAVSIIIIRADAKKEAKQ